MEGGDDALADKPYARSIPFDKHASGSDKETLDRQPLDAAWNRVGEYGLESPRLSAVHARSIDEQSRRASILC